jgi:hypothetical protein
LIRFVVRILTVLTRWRKQSLAKAFSKWVSDRRFKAVSGVYNKQLSQLQMEILVLNSKLHDIASTTNVQAALAGERAINR